MTIKWNEQWVEVFSVALLVLGFILSILLRSQTLTLVSVILAGFLAGRVYYCKKSKEPILPFILMIVGFLVGYLLGGFWASPFWTLLLFAIGFIGSYYLHLKKIIVIFKSEGFVK